MAAHRLGKALIVLMRTDGEVLLVLGTLYLIWGLKISIWMSCHENGYVWLLIQMTIMIMQLNLLVRTEVTGNNSYIIYSRSGIEIVALLRISILINNLLRFFWMRKWNFIVVDDLVSIWGLRCWAGNFLNSVSFAMPIPAYISKTMVRSTCPHFWRLLVWHLLPGINWWHWLTMSALPWICEVIIKEWLSSYRIQIKTLGFPLCQDPLQAIDQILMISIALKNFKSRHNKHILILNKLL